MHMISEAIAKLVQHLYSAKIAIYILRTNKLHKLLFCLCFWRRHIQLWHLLGTKKELVDLLATYNSIYCWYTSISAVVVCIKCQWNWSYWFLNMKKITKKKIYQFISDRIDIFGRSTYITGCFNTFRFFLFSYLQ